MIAETGEGSDLDHCALLCVAPEGVAPEALTLKWPENGNEDHAQNPENQVQRQADLDEVTEFIAAGAVHHGIGLIANGGCEAGRSRKRDGDQERRRVYAQHIGGRHADGR